MAKKFFKKTDPVVPVFVEGKQIPTAVPLEPRVDVPHCVHCEKPIAPGQTFVCLEHQKAY